MSRPAVARTLALVAIAAWGAWAFLSRPSDEPFVLSPHERACDALLLYVSENDRLPADLRELFGGPTPTELGPTQLQIEERKAALVFHDASGATRAECGFATID